MSVAISEVRTCLTATIVTITLNLVMSALVLLLFPEHTPVQCVVDNNNNTDELGVDAGTMLVT